MEYEQGGEDTKRELSYTRLSNNLKDEFERKYLASRHEFISQNEEEVKKIFKEIYDLEEENAYLDLNIHSVLESVKEIVLNPGEFNYQGNAKARETLRNVQQFSVSNLENLATNLSTLENFGVVQQFFEDRVRPCLKQNMADISKLERTFDPIDSIPELKEQFKKLQETYQKLLKVARKSRELKICFPFEPSRLSDLLSPADKEAISRDQIEKLGATCRAFFQQVQRECESALAISDTDVQPKDNARIRSALKVFYDFLSEQNNPLDQFFASLYNFRDGIYNTVLDTSADSANLILKKTQVYRTYVFIKFFKEQISPEIEKQISAGATRLREILESPSPEAEFEKLSILIRKKQFPKPDSHQLLQEWTSRQDNYS